jgi:predicted porin
MAVTTVFCTTLEGWTDMLPEFGGDSYTKADNFMTGRERRGNLP